MRIGMVGILAALAGVTLGCGLRSDLSGLRIASSEQSPHLEHDLGLRLAPGRPIRWSFPVESRHDRPLRVTSVEALSPCCSEVLSAPSSVPAGTQGELIVRLKPGYETGRWAVAFRLVTDDADQPSRTYTLWAELVAELEVRPIGDGPTSLLVGESGARRFRVRARRLGEEGRALPERVEGLDARFLAEADVRHLDNGIVEATRDLVVQLPPRETGGSQSATLTFVWLDGQTLEHRVNWTVLPHLSASPEALVFTLGETVERTVLLRSTTSTFRVRGVEGGPELRTPLEALDVASGLHSLRLAFGGDWVGQPGAYDIAILTDHALQPRVTVSVLVTPRKHSEMK